GNLPGGCEGLFQRHRALFEPLGQRWTIYQLHHHVSRTNVVEMADVEMVQCRDSQRFMLEAFGETLSGNLDSDFAVKARVPCAVNFTHTTLADGGQNFVGAELITHGKRHLSGESIAIGGRRICFCLLAEGTSS